VADLTEDNQLYFARSSRVAVIAFLGSDNQPERKVFDAVAERWRAHYSFGNVDGFEKDSNGPSIAVYTQEEEDPVYYRGPFTVPDVVAFLRDATQPLIREYDPIVHEEAMTVSNLPQDFISTNWSRMTNHSRKYSLAIAMIGLSSSSLSFLLPRSIRTSFPS
jgi:protein disulfide-isomerase A1